MNRAYRLLYSTSAFHIWIKKTANCNLKNDTFLLEAQNLFSLHYQPLPLWLFTLLVSQCSTDISELFFYFLRYFTLSLLTHQKMGAKRENLQLFSNFLKQSEIFLTNKLEHFSLSYYYKSTKRFIIWNLSKTCLSVFALYALASLKFTEVRISQTLHLKSNWFLVVKLWIEISIELKKHT